MNQPNYNTILFFNAITDADTIGKVIEHGYYNATVDISCDDFEAFCYVCRYGPLKLAQKMYNDNKNITNTSMLRAFYDSAKRKENNSIEVMSWLLSTKRITQDRCMEIAFVTACFHGNVDIVKHLMTITKIDIHFMDELPFRKACAGGQIKIIDLLLDIGGINYNAQDNYAFRHACANGHFKVARLLYKFGCVDAKSLEHALNWAAYYGRTTLVKWLLHIGANSDNVLEYACRGRRRKIAVYLKEINKANFGKNFFEIVKNATVDECTKYSDENYTAKCNDSLSFPKFLCDLYGKSYESDKLKITRDVLEKKNSLKIECNIAPTAWA